MAITLFKLKRVTLFRDGVLNPLAHFHPVTLAQAEVEAAIRAVEELDFPTDGSDPFKKASDLLSKAILTPEELLDAACWLRAAFEYDLRVLLSNHNGKVIYRDDGTLAVSDYWDAAQETMQRVNPTAASSLIASIVANKAVFLDNWRYDCVSLLQKMHLDAACVALTEPGSKPVRTRLAAFA